MIAYDLQCANGHSFEGWFEDAQAYDKQKAEGLIACPVCNVTSVNRIPSTFAIKSSQNLKQLPTHQKDLIELGNKIIDYVENNFDDVGCDFAKEALKMHYGVTKPRNIKGVSTKEEEKTLKDEGIQFFKIPMPPPPDSDA